MVVIRIPFDEVDTITLEHLRTWPHGLNSNPLQRVHSFEVKSHNFHHLNWRKQTRKGPENSNVEVTSNLNNAQTWKVKASAENRVLVRQLQQMLLKSNLCELEVTESPAFLKLDLKQVLRNGTRSLDPTFYLHHLVIELLQITEVEVNFEYTPLIYIESRRVKSNRIAETIIDRNHVLLEVPEFIQDHMQQVFTLKTPTNHSRHRIFEVPSALLGYSSYYKTLINFLELYHSSRGGSAIQRYEMNLDLRFDFKKGPILVEHLGYEYHNICKLGSLKTSNARELVNPSGNKKYYYSSVLEPLLEHYRILMTKIPKGYTIQDQKFILWNLKSKKADPTLKYLKNLFEHLCNGPVLNRRESSFYDTLRKSIASGCALNVILSPDKKPTCCFYEHKDFFVIVYSNWAP